MPSTNIRRLWRPPTGVLRVKGAETSSEFQKRLRGSTNKFLTACDRERFTCSFFDSHVNSVTRPVFHLLTTCCDHSELRRVIVCATFNAFSLPFPPQVLLAFSWARSYANGKSREFDPQLIHRQPTMFPAGFTCVQLPFPTVRTASNDSVEVPWTSKSWSGKNEQRAGVHFDVRRGRQFGRVIHRC